jgi:N-acetylmuramoyl-L-alanine amidase
MRRVYYLFLMIISSTYGVRIGNVMFHEGLKRDVVVLFSKDSFSMAHKERVVAGKKLHTFSIRNVDEVDDDELSRLNALEKHDYTLSCKKLQRTLTCSLSIDQKKHVAYVKKIQNMLAVTVAKKQVARQKARRRSLVVIDAGHGGHDLGALGLYQLQEKNIVLSVAKKVRAQLLKYHYDVRLVRTNDTHIRLDDRTTYANKLAPAVFVSLHSNHAPNHKARGIETFYFNDNSRAFADSVHTALVKDAFRGAMLVDRGVKHAPFQVLFGSECPAILVELLFLSNKDDAYLLKTSRGQDFLARSLAEGIHQHLSALRS